MIITKEQAKIDLEKVMSQYGTVGSGTERDRAARLVMQTIEVLERRLGNPEVIKRLYIGNPDASKLLPQTAYEVVQQYVNGEVDQTKAANMLQDALKQYREVFQEMGVQPQESSTLVDRSTSARLERF